MTVTKQITSGWAKPQSTEGAQGPVPGPAAWGGRTGASVPAHGTGPWELALALRLDFKVVLQLRGHGDRTANTSREIKVRRQVPVKLGKETAMCPPGRHTRALPTDAVSPCPSCTKTH